MANHNLSPLAIASRDLVVRLSDGAHPADIEAGCRELLRENTNGLGSIDTQMVDVASEIVRGVLSGIVLLRSPTISAATRGVSDSGTSGEAGDAYRLSVSERTCRDVRDSDDASPSDYNAALDGAAPAARMSSEELRKRIDSNSPEDLFTADGSPTERNHTVAHESNPKNMEQKGKNPSNKDSAKDHLKNPPRGSGPQAKPSSPSGPKK